MPAPSLGFTTTAIVDRIIDGDTIDLHILVPARIRLRDLWAPETRGEEKERGLISKKSLETIAPSGAKVIINVPTIGLNSIGEVTSLGRIVADVWRYGDDESLSDAQVRLVMGTKSKIKPPAGTKR